MRRLLAGFAALGVALVSAPACAQETVTYSYDALGRLVASTTSGGPNSGVSTGIGYDPAGNRSTYTVTVGTASLKLGRELTRMLAERAERSRSVGIGS